MCVCVRVHAWACVCPPAGTACANVGAGSCRGTAPASRCRAERRPRDGRSRPQSPAGRRTLRAGCSGRRPVTPRLHRDPASDRENALKTNRGPTSSTTRRPRGPGAQSRGVGRGCPWVPVGARAPPPAYLHQRGRVHHVHEVQVPGGAPRHVRHTQVQVAHPGVQLLRHGQRLSTRTGVRRTGSRSTQPRPGHRLARAHQPVPRGPCWAAARPTLRGGRRPSALTLDAAALPAAPPPSLWAVTGRSPPASAAPGRAPGHPASALGGQDVPRGSDCRRRAPTDSSGTGKARRAEWGEGCPPPRNGGNRKLTKRQRAENETASPPSTVTAERAKSNGDTEQ